MTPDRALEDCYYHAPDVSIANLGDTVVVYVDATPAVVLSQEDARSLAHDLIVASHHTTPNVPGRD